MRGLVAECSVAQAAGLTWSQRLRDDGAVTLWHTAQSAAPSCVIAADAGGQVSLYESQSVACAVESRLDDREDLAASVAVKGSTVSDACLIGKAFEQNRIDGLTRIVGDFAVVLWDKRERQLMLYRDAFGLKPLYYAQTTGGLRVSTTAAVLSVASGYDREYIAEFLVFGENAGNSTIYPGVKSVPPGSVVVCANGQTHWRRVWTASDYAPSWSSHSETVTEFRSLLERAVGSAMTHDHIWSQLSGGLDSSSIVCTAEHRWRTEASAHRLAGTITFADSLGHSDERAYVDSVVAKCGCRNRVMSYGWPWRDDGLGRPPLTDVPKLAYTVHARDREMTRVVREEGGLSLLSGEGSDLFLGGSAIYISDLLARGRLTSAAGEALRWAIGSRRSFWRYMLRYGVGPLLPTWLQNWTTQQTAVPTWVDHGFTRALRVDERLRQATGDIGGRGDKFASLVRRALTLLPYVTHGTNVTDVLEVRYPFLYRPLVQFSLQLSPTMRAQPNQKKGILRSAMKDILPERVRTRTGKGGIGARVVWSFTKERATIDHLLKQSVLEELGCINVPKLRRELSMARRGVYHNTVLLHATLALETWLSVHAGRWPSEPSSDAGTPDAGRHDFYRYVASGD
jgi:asparagine synthase (glutamine-hydrolysing)